nr:uncharacterized protein LOC124500518 [Dermatophagoides farinae]
MMMMRTDTMMSRNAIIKQQSVIDQSIDNKNKRSHRHRLIREISLLNGDFEQKFNPFKLIDPSYAVRSVGTQFYRYGIHLYRPDCLDQNYRRHWFYNPAFVLSIGFIYILRSIVALFISTKLNENRRYFIYLGDWPWCMGAKTHINIAAIVYTMMGISVQLMCVIHYIRGIRPTFLQSLDFLGGRCPSSDARLHDAKLVAKLLAKTRFGIQFCRLNMITVGVVSFILSAWPLWFKCSLNEFIIFGLPWSVFFGVSSSFTYTAYSWNLIYFYIICSYLRYRIREINELVMKWTTNTSRSQCGTRKITIITMSHIDLMRRQFNQIGNDIQQFSSEYFSKVLFFLILFVATFINVVLYTSIFMPIDLTVRISLLYSVVLAIIVIFFLLNTASSVYEESLKSLKILNNFNISQMGRLNTYCAYDLMFAIENQSKKRMGFYFFNFFIITYFKFFIVGLIIAYFLKVTQMSSQKRLA